MKRYTMVALDCEYKPVLITWTEEEIFDFYWDYWKEKMKKKEGTWNDCCLSELVQMCIDDWVTVHWAWEVK